jgi:hypothetical protein
VNRSLPNVQSFPLIRDELREVADTWRSVLFGTALGMLHLFTSTLALRKSDHDRKILRHPGHEAPGNWRR